MSQPKTATFTLHVLRIQGVDYWRADEVFAALRQFRDVHDTSINPGFVVARGTVNDLIEMLEGMQEVDRTQLDQGIKRPEAPSLWAWLVILLALFGTFAAVYDALTSIQTLFR